MMKITLKDGSVKEYENQMAVIDIAKDISEGLARMACAGEIHRLPVNLSRAGHPGQAFTDIFCDVDHRHLIFVLFNRAVF